MNRIVSQSHQQEHQKNFETLIGLVSRYSPSGQEREVVEWLVGRMKSLGYEDAFIDKAGNAVGVVGKGPKQVILLGHIDTVPGEIPVGWDASFEGASAPIPPHEVLYGRGAVDAKGPLACFVDAVAKVGVKDEWQFVVIGAVEEERNSEGARFVVTQYQPDFAIIGEPNQWDRVALGYKGSAWANIIVKCGQAHTASGEQTAAEAAVEAWLKIKAYVDSYNIGKQKTFDKLLLTLQSIESDSNDFEQWAELEVGVRLPVDVSPEQWYEKLDEISGDSHFESDCHLSVEQMGYAIPAWKGEKNNSLVRVFLSVIRSKGREPRFVYKTGTADSNIVAPVWRCPVVVYGPGDSALDHTPSEHLDLNEYTQAVDVLRETLRRLVSS